MNRTAFGGGIVGVGSILMLAMAAVASDGLVELAGKPLIIRDQTETRFAAFDSADCFDDLPECDAACADDCDCGYGSHWDNTSIFLAADSWRTRADDDYPGSQGFRTGFNSGIGWWDCPVRVQLGASYAGYDLSGRDGDVGADRLHSSSAEQQLFFTGGVYRRSDVCEGVPCSWGAVIDVIYDNHFGEQAQEILLTQARGIVGYALDECNEFGVWGASRMNWQRLQSDVAPGRFRVRGLTQANMFWHRNWACGGDTWLYVGAAEEPGEWVLGMTGQAPLSPSVALFGGFAWGIPSAPAGDQLGGQNYSEEYWNLSFGIVWYPGCKAKNNTVSGQTGLPLLPVADNGTFMVFARPGNL
jgi:Family of unknown function (DUF6666)